MGGFAFDSGHKPPGFFPGLRELTRLGITADGILELARRDPNVIPDISEAVIKDKGKANDLTNTLVCLQALWFLAQTIGRIATGYPIALLEWNTALHAVICLAIYAFWWHKPLEINEPTLIDISDNANARKVAAWMITYSSTGDHLVLGRSLWGNAHTKPDPKRLGVVSLLSYKDRLYRESRYNAQDILHYQEKLSEAEAYNTAHGRANFLQPSSTKIQWTEHGNLPVFKLFPGQVCCGFRFHLCGHIVSEDTYQMYILLSAREIECLQLAQSLRIAGSHEAWKFDSDPRDHAPALVSQNTIT
jgi:hypothetical protein